MISMMKTVECENGARHQEVNCDVKDAPNILYTEKESLNRNKKPKMYIVISVLLLVTVATVIGGWYYREKKTERLIQEYSENFDVAISLMLQGADEAGACCSFIDQVWYNAIYEKNSNITDKYTKSNDYFVSDFNKALDNLFADADFMARIEWIMANQDEAGAAIRKLGNPPEQFVNSYQSLSMIYDAYLFLTDMAISPTGSLNTFSGDLNKADTEFVRCCQMLKIDTEQYQRNREAEKALRRSREYLENLRNAVQTMLSGAVDAESCCNLIVQVWNNAIWEKGDSETDKYTRPDGYFVTDFNDALDNLFSDSDFYAQIGSIKENQMEVDSIVGLLVNPPEEYKNAYESLAKCYDAYRRFISMAINPTGSLNSFSEDFNNIDKEFIRCYQAMDFYLQDS